MEKLSKKLMAERFGFVTESEVPTLIAEDRLMLLLVRCGGGRFICPAQDVQHFIDIIKRDGKDYVRDVSIYKP